MLSVPRHHGFHLKINTVIDSNTPESVTFLSTFHDGASRKQQPVIILHPAQQLGQIGTGPQNCQLGGKPIEDNDYQLDVKKIVISLSLTFLFINSALFNLFLGVLSIFLN